MLSKAELEDMILKNDMLFNKIFMFEEEFSILPEKPHFGAAIKYIDIKECREGFVNELLNTIIDWVYSINKSEIMIDKLRGEGRSYLNSASEIRRSAMQKFRSRGDGELLQGQFGELLLFCFLQKLFGAAPLLRKMPITTSSKHERFGADAIHYKMEGEKNIFYLGESKVYKSNYKFNAAFEDAINSILKTYEELDNEMNLYIYEDFLDDRLQEIAMKYKNSELENVEVHLVNFIMYSETNKLDGDSQGEIDASIREIISNRYSKFENEKIDIDNNKILKRITYIVFPVWEINSLLKDFGSKIGG